jgi:hypothetical protein
MILRTTRVITPELWKTLTWGVAMLRPLSKIDLVLAIPRLAHGSLQAGAKPRGQRGAFLRLLAFRALQAQRAAQQAELLAIAAAPGAVKIMQQNANPGQRWQRTIQGHGLQARDLTAGKDQT